MEHFDLAFAYVWEYDTDFIELVENKFHEAGLTTYIISDHNIKETTKKVTDKKLYFSYYLDRAWDVDERYENLGKILRAKKTKIINPYRKVHHAIDKASMHLEFITAKLHVPYSIIIPPFNEKKDIYISTEDLSKLGRPFIIKPCNTTGGGTGVVTGAETLREVLKERSYLEKDKYILQEKIYPQIINGKRAWFRCFYAFGTVIPTLWDDLTHIYEEISYEDQKLFNYRKLIQITKTINNIIGLDFFSTEIVLTPKKKFVVIDYVNDQCDMRIKSKHYDGVPDEVVEIIIGNLLRMIMREVE